MKKNMKLLIVLAVIIVLVAIAILIVKMVSKPEYTADEIADLVEIKFTDNMYMKEENYFTNDSGNDVIYERYFKDGILYVKSEKSNTKYDEYICDFNNKYDITINHIRQEIIKVNNYSDYDMKSKNSLEEHLKINKGFLDFNEKSDKKYKYDGKEVIDGKEYTKCSGIYSDYKYTVYIDSENKYISRIETYDKVGFKYKLSSTSVYTYSYNTITDDDILKFDISNYPNYTFEELSKEE